MTTTKTTMMSPTTSDGLPAVGSGAAMGGGGRGAMAMSMTVQEARERRVCRICGERWRDIQPGRAFVSNYGTECAHRDCLDREQAEADEAAAQRRREEALGRDPPPKWLGESVGPVNERDDPEDFM
jgi:hypothetical protein